MKTADGTLAVCCEECMSAWPSPEDINDPAKATFDEFGLEGMPTYQETLEQGDGDKIFLPQRTKGDKYV